MKKFTINGKNYNAIDFGFDMMCDFQEAGLNIEELGDKTMLFVRLYFAFCSGLDKHSAGNEISEHIVNGGSLDEIMEVFQEAVLESDFFQAITKSAEKKPRKVRKTEKEESQQVTIDA